MAPARRKVLPRLAKAWLRLTGWKLVGERPSTPKLVVISQHTSNWDAWYLLLFALAFDIRVSWIGKHTLFRGPLGPIARWLGGVPVDRSAHHDLVAQLADAFRARDQLILVMAPEGTRHRVEHWKSGFYHVARSANVPVVLARLDYRRREGGFGEQLSPSGDLKADMDRIRAFYADVTPCKPEQAGPIRLKEEQPEP
jgi:1-acyl-sn-glycerol-3-phosphate acyltransferase